MERKLEKYILKSYNRFSSLGTKDLVRCTCSLLYSKEVQKSVSCE